MNKLKRIILVMACVMGLAATAPLPAVRAVEAGNINKELCDKLSPTQKAQTPACAAVSAENPISGPTGIIIKAARILSLVIGVTAVIMIMVGGVKFITAAGEPAKISAARNTVMYAAIGLAIAAIAQGVVAFILNVLN